MDSAPYQPTVSSGTIQGYVQNILDKAGVNALDADFILLFLFAMIMDALDILHITLVGIIITTILDALLFCIMFVWDYIRGKRIENAKQEAEDLLNEYTKQQGGAAGRAARITRFTVRTGVTRRLLIRTLRRVGLVAIAEFIPFLGMMPWWTILMLLALRRKAELEPS
jgi:hypothetical protein